MNWEKKFWLAVAIVISFIVAVVATIWLLGGRLAWVVFVMNFPFPDWLKGGVNYGPIDRSNGGWASGFQRVLRDL